MVGCIGRGPHGGPHCVAVVVRLQDFRTRLSDVPLTVVVTSISIANTLQTGQFASRERGTALHCCETGGSGGGGPGESVGHDPE